MTLFTQDYLDNIDGKYDEDPNKVIHPKLGVERKKFKLKNDVDYLTKVKVIISNFLNKFKKSNWTKIENELTHSFFKSNNGLAITTSVSSNNTTIRLIDGDKIIIFNMNYDSTVSMVYIYNDQFYFEDNIVSEFVEEVFEIVESR